MDATDQPADLRVTVPSTPAGCADATRLLTTRLTTWATTERARYIVELALEEVLTNIARYAYAAHTGSIEVCMQRRSDTLVLAFEDAGRPFNPTERDASPAGGTLETATVGGRGILMMRNLTQSMRYERRGDRNHLELVIANSLPSPASPATAASSAKSARDEPSTELSNE